MKKRNVGILVFDDAEVLDFAGPFEVFSVTTQEDDFKPFDVFTIEKNGQQIKAVNGLQVLPDYSFNNHPQLDILIVSGGSGSRKVMHDIEVLEWIRKTHEKTELTVCICSGSRLIGKLGLLDEKVFCTHHTVYDHMKEIAPKAIPQKDKRFIQTDTRLFTSGGISAGIDLSFHVVEKLLGSKTAKATAEYMEYTMA